MDPKRSEMMFQVFMLWCPSVLFALTMWSSEGNFAAVARGRLWPISAAPTVCVRVSYQGSSCHAGSMVGCWLRIWGSGVRISPGAPRYGKAIDRAVHALSKWGLRN
jgi:hypothetical protein